MLKTCHRRPAPSRRGTGRALTRPPPAA